MGRGSDREGHLGIWAGVVSSTRPDTRQDSRGQLGRGRNAITARNSTKFVTDRRTGRPTQQGVELRVRYIKAKKSRKSKKGTDRPIDRLTTNRQNDLPTDEQSGM